MEQSIVFSAEGDGHGGAVAGFSVTDSHLSTSQGVQKTLGDNVRLAVMARCPVSDITGDILDELQSVAGYVEPTSGKTIQLEVTCSEQEPSDTMLKEVLSALHCETTAVHSRRVPLVGMGRTLFTASCTLKMASERNSEILVDELESRIPGLRARVVEF